MAVAAFAVASSAGIEPRSVVAQTPPTSSGAVDPALLEDLVAANRILVTESVLGASVRTAVGRAIYAEVNVRLQTIEIGRGGPVTSISVEEGATQFKTLAILDAAGNCGKAGAPAIAVRGVTSDWYGFSRK